MSHQQYKINVRCIALNITQNYITLAMVLLERSDVFDDD